MIIPGLGLFGFAKNKKEARITTEFFINAIHVMAGANALDEGDAQHPYPQARLAGAFASSSPATRIMSRCRARRHSASSTGRWKKPSCSACLPKPSSAARSCWSIGGGSGIGREVALLLARKGAHLVVADMNEEAAEEVADEAATRLRQRRSVTHARVNLGSPESIQAAARHTILQFGGIDGIINTAAIFPVGPGPNGQLDGRAVEHDVSWSM